MIRQVCGENRIEIIEGALASDHVHVFVSIPPSLSVSDLMRKMKGRSSHKVQREFPQLKKRYWGRHFWGRVFSIGTHYPKHQIHTKNRNIATISVIIHASVRWGICMDLGICGKIPNHLDCRFLRNLLK
ncbi:MAG: IS200/IS605 family transposase [Hyphomicrobiales bacterium]|nr:IS200/IS605 family transposase [Hyphomicrobiales bacterium]